MKGENKCWAIFIPILFTCDDSSTCLGKERSSLICYKLQYRKNSGTASISLEVPLEQCKHPTNEGTYSATCPSVQWLQYNLLPKLSRWAEQKENSISKPHPSLRLISLEKYNTLYQSMKQKHGERIVKMWPEGTDPQKFVYEDIAIATYLLILWEEERQEKNLKDKQSFVDLGCGNGLLVHLLAEEGHPGKGLDVRQRKIWKMFGPRTVLEESSLDPTQEQMFPNTDWLIGNHSDELTPWIPVIAARSSYNTRYFVLPCCFFDFTGKFVRSDHKMTQYQCYLNFVSQVGVTSGFLVEEDCLRIPSTKRTCHIGRMRTYRQEDFPTVIRAIDELLYKRGFRKNQEIRPKYPGCSAETQVGYHDNHRDSTEGSGNTCGDHSSYDEKVQKGRINEPISDDYTSSNFTARPSKETVRNCASVDKDVRTSIVNRVAGALLQCCERESPHHLSTNVDGMFKGENGMNAWRQGGSISITDLAKHFDRGTLWKLKNECGGLQTLLRNQHHVFKVTKGKVQLRDWRKEPLEKKKTFDSGRREKQQQALWKTSLCWFFANHPDGCPLSADKCWYAHGVHEQRERPSTAYLKSL